MLTAWEGGATMVYIMVSRGGPKTQAGCALAHHHQIGQSIQEIIPVCMAGCALHSNVMIM